MNNTPIKIVIADDNRFFCEALKDSLSQYLDFIVVDYFTSLESLIDFTNNHHLEVLILDVNFNGQSSFDFIQKIKPVEASFKIIALTTMNNNFMKEKATSLGIDCFVGKDSDLSKFKDLILNCYHSDNVGSKKLPNKITVGNYTFTKRKLTILQTIYAHSEKKEHELSKILSITESALKSHKRDLFEITNTKNTPDLIYYNICSVCALVFTLVITSSIIPLSSITKVVRCIPSYSLPINFFGPQTPKALITALSSSANKGNGNSCLLIQFCCLLAESALAPKTSYPLDKKVL